MIIYCNFLKFFFNKFVLIQGWIWNIRFHSNLVFIDLKDITGSIQLIFKKNIFFKFLKLGNCVKILGLVSLRDEKNFEYFLYNGNIEVYLIKIFFINFFLKSFKNYYLKEFFTNREVFFRNIFIQNNLKIKNILFFFSNVFFYFENFYYIETPVLNRFFSEGSKVFVIPFRNNKTFFSLSQSPQIFKQIIMIYGLNKYYQFSKCFRDEDYKNDRNLEFIQLDCELSFINIIDIIFIFENFLFFLIFRFFFYSFVFKFSIIFYNDCINRFLTDKPDLRLKSFFIFFNTFFFIYKLFKFYFYKILNFFFIFGKNFKNFFFLFSNLFILNFFFLKKNFYYFNYFLNIYIFNLIFEIFSNCFILNIFFIFNNINKKLFYNNFFSFNKYFNYNIFFLWVINFNLFVFKVKKYDFLSNPFSSIIYNDLVYLDIFPERCRIMNYDIIVNSIEVGGGSIRNNKSFVQKKIFFISFNFFEISYNFRFFLNSLKFSTPSHGGIAIGIDRLLLIFLGLNTFKFISIFSFSKSCNCFFLKLPNLVF